MPGPASPPAPVIDRRALSDIAYGFMASKALFAALGVDLFTHLSDPTSGRLSWHASRLPWPNQT
jgi:hypothetical protein